MNDTSDLSYSLDCTPRSSPGRVPTADIQQHYLGEDLTRLASFISGAPPDLLYAIMSAATNANLRILLASFNYLDPRIQPSIPMKATCARITRWLETCSESEAISKDVIPYALFLLLKVRVLNNCTGRLRTYNETARLGVAVKVAYGHLCDGTIWPTTLEYFLRMPFYHVQYTELAFLKDLEWRSWVHETDFNEFVGRFKVVWDVLLDYDDNETF
ncbi:hypothetical protein G6011_10168 [Alternaria panax]|uniref:Uncharacterized protein n=1 Tax=Alternaria panax TaxID=48097 RepID=A0AAD4FBV4_9PLEO|nr:hypothetical protein G6011_10168 [Alternaria panax]